jgi:hypothetical protein
MTTVSVSGTRAFKGGCASSADVSVSKTRVVETIPATGAGAGVHADMGGIVSGRDTD